MPFGALRQFGKINIPPKGVAALVKRAADTLRVFFEADVNKQRSAVRLTQHYSGGQRVDCVLYGKNADAAAKLNDARNCGMRVSQKQQHGGTKHSRREMSAEQTLRGSAHQQTRQKHDNAARLFFKSRADRRADSEKNRKNGARPLKESLGHNTVEKALQKNSAHNARKKRKGEAYTLVRAFGDICRSAAAPPHLNNKTRGSERAAEHHKRHERESERQRKKIKPNHGFTSVLSSAAPTVAPMLHA